MSDDVPASLERAVRGLREARLDPVLVGGMALVLLGSRRVTQDFDFVVRRSSADDVKTAVQVMWEAGFRLASRLDREGGVLRYIDNRAVAAARIVIDEQKAGIFWHPGDRLRMDLIFEPLLDAGELVRRAEFRRIGANLDVLVADPSDLAALKRAALADRKAPKDAQDVEFLERLLRRQRR